MRLLLRLAFLLVTAVAGLSAAQTTPTAAPTARSPSAPATFSLVTGREPVASLAGEWRFHPGDDPGWSNPAFDDSGWPLLRSDRSWIGQGYPKLDGFAWYRFTVQGPFPHAKLALLLSQVRTDYQVFANGQLLGTNGRMPPNAELQYSHSQVFPLPPLAPDATLHVAIRVWNDPLLAPYVGGGALSGGEVGPVAEMERRLISEEWGIATSGVQDYALALLSAVVGLTVLGLFLYRRSEREYLWFSVILLYSAASAGISFFSAVRSLDLIIRDSVNGLLSAIFLVASLLFFSNVLEARRGLFWRIALVAAILDPFTVMLYASGSASVAISTAAETLVDLPAAIWIVALLFRRALLNDKNARLLLLPSVLFYGSVFVEGILVAAWQLGWQRKLRGIGAILVHDGLFPMDFVTLVSMIFVVALLAFLIRRFALSRAHEERFEAELEAARSVQQVLVPDELPVVPGLSIATAYHPAQEVGGDFFQVIPLNTGATLIVIGDVAGKGMPAALTVSLIVGTLRTLSDYTDSPAAILGGLNRRLHGRGSRFTTCLVLRFDPADAGSEGTLTLANAGHLPPYRNGRELLTDFNLPLGLDPHTHFPESTFALHEGDHLTALTDGVPEAMHHHELFGFERTKALTTHPAAHIAAAACRFGQSDDITVLTIDIVAVPTQAAALLQPALLPF